MMFKKLWKVTLAFTLMCTQVYQGSMSIFAAERSMTTNTTELQEGEVKSDKSAKWVDPENGIAEITFDVVGKSKKQAVDIAVVYDNSESMLQETIILSSGDPLTSYQRYTESRWYQAQLAVKQLFNLMLNGENSNNQIAFIPFSSYLFDKKYDDQHVNIRNFWNTHEWLYLKEDNKRGKKGDLDTIGMSYITAGGQIVDPKTGELLPGSEEILKTYGYTLKDIKKKDFTAKESGLTNDISKLKGMVDTLFPAGDTLFTGALEHAESALSTNNGHKKVIIFMSDGKANDADTSIVKAEELKNKGYEIYTVGVDIRDSNTGNALPAIASKDVNGNPLYADTTSDDLVSIISGIAGDIKVAGTNAQIVDEIKSEYYDYYEDDTYKPTVDGIEVTAPAFTVSSNGNKSTVTWKIGNITETKHTLKFYVKIKDQYKVTDAVYPTNGDATLTYEDYEHHIHEKNMESPELPTQTGTIIKNNYLVNAEGKYLDAKGNVTKNKKNALIHSETFEKQEVGKEITITTTEINKDGKVYIPTETEKAVKLNWSDTGETSTKTVEFNYIVNYPIHFIVDNAEFDTKSGVFGSSMGKAPVPEKTGYAFQGWFTKENGKGTAYNANKIVKGEETYYAHFTLNTYNYNVEYYLEDVNGDYVLSDDSYSDTAHYNTVKSVNDVKKEFTGYTYNANHKDAVSMIYVNENNNATLKLYFDLNDYNYSIQYVYDGVNGERIDNLKGTYGETITTFEAKDQNGKYHLVGTPSVKITDGENIMYVHYEINKYDVNFNDEDGTLIENKEVNHGDTTTAPADPSKDGYYFTGWFDKDGKEFDPSVEVKEDKDYFAKYEINTYSYKVQHYLQNADGSYTMREEVVPSDKADHGTTLYDVDFIKTYANYHFNKDAKDAVRSVTVVDGNAVLKLYYDINSYNYSIQYVYDGVNGERIDNLTGTYGETITTFDAKDHNGKYHLVGTPSVTITDGENIMYVHYEINKYDVNFNDEDGTLIENKEVNHGDTTTAPNDPAKDGYHFTGWFDKDGKEFDPTAEVTENNDYFAKYEINTYRIDFIDMRQTIKTDIVNHGDKTSAPEDPTRTGFTFTGWVDEYNQPFDADKPVTEDAVYYASYKRDSYAYDVEYYKQSLDGSYYKSFESYTYKGTYGQIVKAEGSIIKEFTGYTYNPANVNAVSEITVTEDGKATLKLYYDLDTISYKVQYFFDGVLDAALTETGTGYFGQVIDQYADKVKVGYHFDSAATITLTADADKNILEVHYVINKYDVNFNDEDGKLIENKEVNHGDTTTAPNDPAKDGYHFIGWFDKDGKEFDPTAEVTEDKDYFAKYEINTYSYKVQHYLQNADGSYTMKEEVVPSDKADHGTTLHDVNFVKDYANYHFNKDAKDAVRSVTVVDGNAVLKLYYDMDQTTYQVQYFFNGVLDAALTETGTGYVGQVINQYPDKVKVGYHLDSAAAITLTANADKNILEVHYVINKYDVNFNDEDGKLIENKEVNHGDTTTAPADPSKDGYHFTGWFDKDGKEFDPTAEVTENKDYFAKYEINTYSYKVQHYLQNADGSYTMEEVVVSMDKVNHGTTLHDVDYVKDYANYHFNKDAKDAVRSVTVTDGNAVLKLYYDLDTTSYQVHYFFDGVHDTTLDESGTGYIGQVINSFTDHNKEGYHLESAQGITLRANADENILEVHYVMNEYNVYFVVDNVVIKTEIVKYGQDAHQPVNPVKDGYVFIGWDKEFTNIKQDTTVYAMFEEEVKPVLHTVNFFTPDGTLIDSQQVEHGNGAIAPSGFHIPEGYTFVGWDKAFDVVNSDLDVYAIYEAIIDPQPETHTVIFLDQNGNEIKRQEVNHGDDATAPVPPVVEGYDFVSWDKDFTNVVTDLVVTAEYKIQQFTVTFVGRDGEIITSQVVDYGKDATAPQAPSYDGYTFVGWDKTFTNVKENLIVTALYEEVITPIDPIDPIDPVDPTNPVDPIDPVIPVTPVVPVPPTPIVVNPVPDTPITPVIPTPTPTPQPTPTPDPEQGEDIDDNETPLAGPGEDGCWVHWLMLLLTIIYAIYAAIRIFFRANNNSNLKDDRKDLEEEIEDFKKGAQAA